MDKKDEVKKTKTFIFLQAMNEKKKKTLWLRATLFVDAWCIVRLERKKDTPVFEREKLYQSFFIATHKRKEQKVDSWNDSIVK